jgi:general secretion pathway protein F
MRLMPVFHYQATRADGTLVRDQITADDQTTAVTQIQATGLTLIQIKPSATPATTWLARWHHLVHPQRLQRRDIEHFTLELSTLLQAGLPLTQALQSLQRLTHQPALRQLCQSVQQALRQGDSLAVALPQSSRLFDSLYCSLIRVGEASGQLETTLHHLADWQARNRRLQEAVVSALIYPSILIMLSVVAMTILLVLVVPQFATLFDQSGQPLPWIPRLLIGLGQLLSAWGLWLCGAGVLATWMLRQHWRSARGRKQKDRWMLQLPLIGPWLIQRETALLARTLATLLRSGMSLLPALEIVRQAMPNQVFADLAEQATARVRQGERLSTALQAGQQLPALAIELIQVGETSGDLAPMLERVAERYEATIQTSLQRLLSLLEPTIILLIAALVTLVILSMVSLMLDSHQLLF